MAKAAGDPMDLRMPQVDVLLSELRAAMATVSSDPNATKRQLEQLIRLLGERANADMGGGNDPGRTGHALAPWQAKRIATFIDANLDQPIPIQDLADLARLSVSYFFRAFRGSFGTAPHGYILQRRIELAQRCLREGTQPISQVALDCGFADQAHFSRAFAKHAGVPPGAWRRMQQRDPRVGISNTA
ncbi:helix-turn-helix transcriptional regulator [Sandarakinorhabdus oryzae]|uniref:helix-turn-helix transcriptional regulator n=1 Tax=Sandarakinorhabdus oryzae TaxID=2675220 RepID=UPI0012E220CE|nr:AraC family transcriptional regulator [Sandarakinorhabdus oryzae]